jgi:hypothetical protein
MDGDFKLPIQPNGCKGAFHAARSGAYLLPPGTPTSVGSTRVIVACCRINPAFRVRQSILPPQPAEHFQNLRRLTGAKNANPKDLARQP